MLCDIAQVVKGNGGRMHFEIPTHITVSKLFPLESLNAVQDKEGSKTLGKPCFNNESRCPFNHAPDKCINSLGRLSYSIARELWLIACLLDPLLILLHTVLYL